MVSNNDLNADEEIATLAKSLLTHVNWARQNHVRNLPTAVSSQYVEEPVMPTPKVDQKTVDTNHAIAALIEKAGSATIRLKTLQSEIIGDCQRCRLCEQRTQVVFGVGDPDAKLVFIGEGPGADEDRLGEPFVGRSGQLLTKMIEAMGLSRDRIYICNVVKCRPPNNRDPEPDEVLSCEPFLKAQLAIIKPKVIVTLGRYACQALIKTTTPMSQIRGQWTQYEGIDLMPTFHPAFLLRNPTKKKEVWEDLQQVMQRLGLS